MLARFLKYSPEILIYSDLLPNLLLLADIGIGIKHKQAAKAVYSFIMYLYDLFILGEDEEETPARTKIRISLYQDQKSLNFALKLINVIKDVPPSSVREYVYDLCITIMKAFP